MTRRPVPDTKKVQRVLRLYIELRGGSCIHVDTWSAEFGCTRRALERDLADVDVVMPLESPRRGYWRRMRFDHAVPGDGDAD